ncbi:MAG: hypothetical protein ACK53K_05380 [Burkholderiales bacterium]|jgi:hypothetical protein
MTGIKQEPHVLRFLLIGMVFANVVFFSWSQGWLGSSVLGDREPERINFSYKPDAVRMTPVVSSISCFESGPYLSADVPRAELALAGIAPIGTWTTQRQERQGLWVIYLGPFPDMGALSKKEPDLQNAKISYEIIRDQSDLNLGFVLGRFAQIDQANEAQRKLAAQAPTRNATVVNLVQPASLDILRLEGPSQALAQRLMTLKTPALKPFTACDEEKS